MTTADSPQASGCVVTAAVAVAAAVTLAARSGCGTLVYGVLGGRAAVDGVLFVGALAVQGRGRLPWLAADVPVVAAVPIVCSVLAAAVAVLAAWPRRPRSDAAAAAAAPPWPGPDRPLLFPCMTTHARLFPQAHAFVYSYLVVGVPVGWRGSRGGLISTAAAERAWFHVDASDYLARGRGHLGLRGKLDAHLSSQGIDPALYPHAYLVTAARFLGYHFNPVSFWFLYDDSRTLVAMVLEVNNTFGERRMYFLRAETATRGETDEADEAEADEDADDGSSADRLFTQAWPKDLHVSPFSSRKGAYVLRARDPLAPRMQGAGPLAVAVELRSSHGRRKLVARLRSQTTSADGTDGTDGTPRWGHDPAHMSAGQRARFLAAWWWVGLATFPRIVRQAGALFVRRRLHVWFRPEPRATSMARAADAAEQQLEAVFRAYLRYRVAGVAGAAGVTDHTRLAVSYVPSGLPEPSPERMLSPAAAEEEKKDADADVDVDELDFRVLTPAFYTRFVRYADDDDALRSEAAEHAGGSDSGRATVAVSPRLVEVLVAAGPETMPPPARPLDALCSRAVRALRRRPAPIEPMTWPPARRLPGGRDDDDDHHRQASGPSPMDRFVLALADEADPAGRLRRTYWTAVLALVLADWAAWGSVPLLRAQGLALRAAAVWLAAQGVVWLLSLRSGSYLISA